MTNAERAERNAGLLLIAAAAIALIIANSPWGEAWHHLLEMPLGLALPQVGMLTPHLFVADALMAIFFLLVGLEVKREWYEGRLDTPQKRRLPIIAAVAGMAVPALVYWLVSGGDPALLRGWAIPAATDIAFAIGVLALLGPRAPAALKLLLVTIAVVDDIGAVIIIALAYTASLNVLALGAAVAILGVMAALGQMGVRRLWPFLLLLPFLWFAVLASGVHATIAGVLGALAIPLARGEAQSPLKRLEHAIHPWVMFGVVPLFGLVSAGVKLGSLGLLLAPLPLAIALGLFVGKQVGIFLSIRAAVGLGLAPRPAGVTWRQLYGAAVLCGIGFTMSLFIGALAFADPALVDAAKIGTLAGSLASALLGFALLRTSPPMEESADDLEDEAELFAGTPEGRA